MRLINTETLQLEEHNDQQLPSYVILSHRWYAANEEVTFHDIQNSHEIASKKGWKKLNSFCHLAHSMGYKWAWSDTCCIDKHSATELGTALNSMYRWYAISGVCVAYLGDVGHRMPFEESVWFTRGWTLQELIAPTNMLFFNRDWKKIGTKKDLASALSRRTGIEESVLTHEDKPEKFSIAQRMSWASGRVTERLEDRAYSLLGLFNVTLSMVYGEGEKAFIRLQERIIQQSADQSIFTWSLDVKSHPRRYSGMLAQSPEAFVNCGRISKGAESRGFSSSNIGLSIELDTVPYSMNAYLAFLDCYGSGESNVAILVAKLPDNEQWARIMNHDGESVFFPTTREEFVRRKLFLRQAPQLSPLYFNRVYGIWLRDLRTLRKDSKVRILSRMGTRVKDCVYLAPGMSGTAGIVHIEPFRGRSRGWAEINWIKVGFDDEFNPVVMIARNDSDAISRGAFRDFDRTLSSGSVNSHRRVFRNDWLRNQDLTSEQRDVSAKDAWRKGYYVLRPDGLPEESGSRRYSEFRVLNLDVRLSLLPETRDGPHIWTVELLERQGRSTNLSYWVAQSKSRSLYEELAGNVLVASIVLLLAATCKEGIERRFKSKEWNARSADSDSECSSESESNSARSIERMRKWPPRIHPRN